MTRFPLAALAFLTCLGVLPLTSFADDGVFWSQWGHDPQHTGMVSIPAQPLNEKLADIVYDHSPSRNRMRLEGSCLRTTRPL